MTIKRAPKLTPDNCFHPDTKVEGDAVGFWLVEGSATAPMYKAIILGRTKGGRSRTVSFRAASSAGLAKQMADGGWEAPPVPEIARLCESAGTSKGITRNARFISEVRVYTDGIMSRPTAQESKK